MNLYLIKIQHHVGIGKVKHNGDQSEMIQEGNYRCTDHSGKFW